MGVGTLPPLGGLDHLPLNSFNYGWKLALKATTFRPTKIYDYPLAPWIISAIKMTRNFNIFQHLHFLAQDTMTKAITDTKGFRI